MQSVVAEAWGPEGYGGYEIRLEADSWSFARKTDRHPTHVACPGFVDVHIHGAFGTDFMSASADEILDLDGRLRAIGYEAWLPTTVTASLEDVGGALARLPNVPSVLGFHLEGPFISKMFPGAQPPEWILDAWPPRGTEPWDWDLQVLTDKRLRLITLAPENAGALPWVQTLVAWGVVVSVGHTNATYKEAAAAVELGASHATHTCNAMRGFHHREAGVLGLALTDHRVNTELIYDRLHVSPQAARLLIQAKPLRNLVAVSDSTLATGLASGSEVTMWGHPCVVGEGEVRLKRNGALAGSCITLAEAFRNLATDFGPEVAIAMCSLNPARILGYESRKLLLFDRDLNLVETAAARA